ncbi:universal stress protein [Actinomadura sp.]|uniref:universal stress protein n=1 Tax=Actinomadura sp. TaxID=1989 RepID=UPI0033584849
MSTRAPRPVHPPAPARIVVGVDGSPASLTALHWAAGEAARRHAEILAVRSWHGRRDRLIASLDRERERARRALAADIRAVLGAEPPVRVRQELAFGNPVRTLLHLAAKADLLVLGDAPRPRGPVRTACLRMSACPVALIPPTPSDRPVSRPASAP